MTQVKLGNYKGIEIPKIVIEVSAEEVNSELERARQMAAEWLTVEKAEDGDEVTIDFEGFLNGKPFEGGKGENYPLTLGSGSFIPGFEEQLLGASKDDDVEVNVTFPAEYHAEELAGKETVFKVKVHNVRRKMIPEMGDEFVAKISPFKTLEELKTQIEKMIKTQKMAHEKQEAAKVKLLDICETTLDEKELEQVSDDFVTNMTQRLQAYGMTLEDYLSMTGSTVEDIKKENRTKAEQMLSATKILGEIAKLENIEATDAEVKGQIEVLSKQYQMPVEQVESMLAPEDRQNIVTDIVLGKAFQFVVDNCVEV